MIAYKRYVTIQDPDRIVLSGLPFRPGQRVEVVVIADEDETAARVQSLKRLFAETQGLPQARTITDEEIAAEIKAYRAES
ncbi:MAG: hypothetical protein WCF84_09140 [Anaerolineae bacterium]